MVYKTCDSSPLFEDKEIAGKDSYEDFLNRFDVIYVDMTNIVLTIDKKTNQIIEAVATMIDDTKQTIKFRNYVMNANLPATTFVFDSKMVPQGIQIIDLR